MKMGLDQITEIFDLMRYSLPYYITVLLPLIIILSPTDAATEFPVYRLQHFDLQGIKYGKKIKKMYKISLFINFFCAQVHEALC